MVFYKEKVLKSSSWEKLKNCLFYLAYSRDLRGRLLQKQARELLSLLSDDGLLPVQRIGLCLADDNPSAGQDFIQGQGEASR